MRTPFLSDSLVARLAHDWNCSPAAARSHVRAHVDAALASPLLRRPASGGVREIQVEAHHLVFTASLDRLLLFRVASSPAEDIAAMRAIPLASSSVAITLQALRSASAELGLDLDVDFDESARIEVTSAIRDLLAPWEGDEGELTLLRGKLRRRYETDAWDVFLSPNNRTVIDVCETTHRPRLLSASDVCVPELSSVESALADLTDTDPEDVEDLVRSALAPYHHAPLRPSWPVTLRGVELSLVLSPSARILRSVILPDETEAVA